MAERDLLNLGTSPDSGTGDSARRGGEKINVLFADIYANFGDNPVGNDPSGQNYGYRKTFAEAEYKVGELHAAGRYTPVSFKSGGTFSATLSTSGWSNTQTTVGQTVPDIYLDSEWYFLSRGESVTADLSDVADSDSVHLVLPLASPGDTVIVRDGFGTWARKTINIWTTPYEWTSVAQVQEWQTATGETYPDSDSISINGQGSSFKSFDNPAVSGTFPGIAVSFLGDTSTGRSPIAFDGAANQELVFTYVGPRTGWLLRRNFLDVDIIARFQAIEARLTAGGL